MDPGGTLWWGRKGPLLQKWAKTLCTRTYVRTRAPLSTGRTQSSKEWFLDPGYAQTHLSQENRAGRRTQKDWEFTPRQRVKAEQDGFNTTTAILLIGKFMVCPQHTRINENDVIWWSLDECHAKKKKKKDNEISLSFFVLTLNFKGIHFF